MKQKEVNGSSQVSDENSGEKYEDLEDYVVAVKSWIARQPHLPQNIDDQILRRFICCSFMSLEKTKHLIDLNYTLRSQAPEIFGNRDPCRKELQDIFDILDLCPLPKMTEKKHKVFIYRVNNSDPDGFNFSDVLKVFFMVADIRMVVDEEISEGEIPIFDMANTTLRHLTRITLPLIKKYMVFTQEAHPVRLRQIHVVNTMPFLDKIMALVRPFMKSEVAKLLNFHTPNSRTLFDHVAPELIPKEYGGTLDVTIDSIKNDWRKRVEANRDFFLDPTKWKVDESKRSSQNGNKARDMFGMQGSFRSLSID